MSSVAAPHAPTAGRPSRPAPAAPRREYLELRATVHRTLLSQLLTEESAPLSLGERETLFAEVLDDVFGLGPLEPLLRDPSISDILVNGSKHVYVERHGQLEHIST